MTVEPAHNIRAVVGSYTLLHLPCRCSFALKTARLPQPWPLWLLPCPLPNTAATVMQTCLPGHTVVLTIVAAGTGAHLLKAVDTPAHITATSVTPLKPHHCGGPHKPQLAPLQAEKVAQRHVPLKTEAAPAMTGRCCCGATNRAPEEGVIGEDHLLCPFSPPLPRTSAGGRPLTSSVAQPCAAPPAQPIQGVHGSRTTPHSCPAAVYM